MYESIYYPWYIHDLIVNVLKNVRLTIPIVGISKFNGYGLKLGLLLVEDNLIDLSD